MKDVKTLKINGRDVRFSDEPNVLEVVRGAGIDIPTFCYHSSLSVYGACRLCVVDIKGRGIVASCSTKPETGMEIQTHSDELREIRKTNIELLLANHEKDCTICQKNRSCELQELAYRLGVKEVRFKNTHTPQPVDESSPSLVRNPNKCILCGDCVRACYEIQGIGAIDFANRGSRVTVGPAFDKSLDMVECVYCGQCAAVCPTGAITPKSSIEEVWQDINNPDKIVIAQIAPAVRVALGEHFGMAAGTAVTGKIIAAMKLLGFDQVYDTSFAADLTVIEEANEFIKRKEKNENLPQFTSCCPAWVKFAEQYYPALLNNLSSCKSPQQMFGSVARQVLPDRLRTVNEMLSVVSIMPCTAKKFEAQRSEFAQDGVRDVNHVLTTQELSRMIEEMGINFADLEPGSIDMPFGFKTGAGVIFGASGGVTEAVLRYASEKITGIRMDNPEFTDLRGEEDFREAEILIGGTTLRMAIVHGLKNARMLADQVVRGECPYDLIEVMACPGGCIGGAGQPVTKHNSVKSSRKKGLFEIDRMLHLHTSQENHFVSECYEKVLGSIGGHKAHHFLHTGYAGRKRIHESEISLLESSVPREDDRLKVRVCVGTGCFVKGSQIILKELLDYVQEHGLSDRVDVQATFCFERCETAPNVQVGDIILGKCTVETVLKELQAQMQAVTV